MNISSLSTWLNAAWSRVGGDILIIQTFRNVIMSASVLASAALVTLMGVLAASSHLQQPAILIIGLCLLLASSASLSVLSIVTFARLGFNIQLDSANTEQLAKRLLFGLRLIQSSACGLVLALILAALFII
jgi:hypothetical protein